MPHFLVGAGKFDKATTVARRCRKTTDLLRGDGRVTYSSFTCQEVYHAILGKSIPSGFSLQPFPQAYFQLFFLSSCLSADAVFITGCSDDNVKVALTGQIDRSLPAGMTVCLDTSGNGKCDTDEPSARTNADGTYSVIIPAKSLGQFPLVVEPTQKTVVPPDRPDSTGREA